MSKRTSYAQGTPCWVDLQTTDLKASKDFYRTVFGWDYLDEDIGGGNIYSMANRNGEMIAAITLQPAPMTSQGVPPAWNTYLAVDDVDAAAKRATDAGGQLAMPVMDVMEAGRMAFAIDPSGAVMGLWQAKEHIGAVLVNEPGTLIWNELRTDNQAGALPFYEKVFGLEPETVEMGGEPYTLLKAKGQQVAGMAGPVPGVPNHWGVYFCVQDVDASQKVAEGAGAKTLMAAFDTPIGKMAAVADPQGAALMFFQPHGETP